jgi:hypothetical protein
MPYDFVKISDVDLVENPNESANVIVEDGGDIKRVPKSAIGAQADWNETDDKNPAYILNKPTNLGGYLYYYYYGYYLYKCADANFERGNVHVSQDEFEADYYSSPILLNNGYVVSPVVGYDNEYSKINFVNGEYLEYAPARWND